MYFYSNNQKGGAQWDISLYVDYYSFEPMWPKRWELENLLPDMDFYSKSSRKLDARKTSISVSSNISSVGSIYYSPVLRDRYIGDGEYCDLTIYRKEKEIIISDPKYRDAYPFNKEGHFFTFIDERYKKIKINEAIKQLKTEDHFYAYCSALNSHTSCYASTNFEGWSLNYHLPKKDLCSWKKIRSRMRDFLSKHVVSRTPMRSTK